jgi:hypothetical protein
MPQFAIHNSPQADNTPLNPLFGNKPQTIRTAHALPRSPIQPSCALLAARFEPSGQVLALADVKDFQDRAALDDGFDADARDADAAADRDLLQLQEVQPDAAQGGVGDGRAAEGEAEVCEVRAAERDDFSGGVGEGAAEGLDGNVSFR